jgi:predicted transcriptional regulator
VRTAKSYRLIRRVHGLALIEQRGAHVRDGDTTVTPLTSGIAIGEHCKRVHSVAAAPPLNSADIERLARELAAGRRVFKNANGRKTYCPLCRPENARRKARPTLSLTAHAGTLLVYCHRCRRPGLEIIRVLVGRGLLPNSFRESSAAFWVVKEILAAIEVVDWHGIAKATDLLVLSALIEIARGSLKAEFGASVRQVAEIARINRATASRSLRRLANAAWVEKIESASGEKAAVWRLPLRKKDRCTTISHAAKEGDRLSPVDPRLGEGDRANQTRPVVRFPHDVFRWGGGLGAIKGQFYTLLATPLTTKEIAARLHYTHDRNARIHLRKLVDEGLIRQRPDARFERTDKSLDEVADRLGVLGLSERQRALHAEERWSFRRWGELFQHWKGTGEVVDPGTGLVFASGTPPRKTATLCEFRRVVLIARVSTSEPRTLAPNQEQL